MPTRDLNRPSRRRGGALLWLASVASAATLALAGACSESLPPEPNGTAPSLRPSAAASLGAPPSAFDIGAALNCPPQTFVTGINLATNPSFELGTGPVSYPPGPNPPPSAATGWFMHTSNQNALVTSARVATNVPGPGGSRMLAFRAGGNEGGVYQQFVTPAKVMFSAWVYVRSGYVQIGTNGANTGPYSFSTKLNEWEQLRVCTDGSVPTGLFFISNQDPNGGVFNVDRVEIKEIP